MSRDHHARARHRARPSRPPACRSSLERRTRRRRLGARRARHRPTPTAAARPRRRRRRPAGTYRLTFDTGAYFTRPAGGLLPRGRRRLHRRRRARSTTTCRCCSARTATAHTEGAETAMSIVLGANSYGKSEVRLVKVDARGRTATSCCDLTVDVALEGDFDAAHTAGDNTGLLATDTMRNTVYALAQATHRRRPHRVASASRARRALPRGRADGDAGARVRLAEHPWARLTVGGAPPARVPARAAAATASRPWPAARRAVGRGRDRRPASCSRRPARAGRASTATQYTSLAGDRRPDHGHGRHRALDVRRPRGHRLRRPRGRRVRDDRPRGLRRPLQPVGAVHAAPHGRGGAGGPAGGRADPLLAARTSTTCCTTWRASGSRTTTRSSTPRRSRTG